MVGRDERNEYRGVTLERAAKTLIVRGVTLREEPSVKTFVFRLGQAEPPPSGNTLRTPVAKAIPPFNVLRSRPCGALHVPPR
ncbi:MAG: hypothetical protein GX575_00635 [Candidatus Anammoximicrobium sp.]|nr:hypothetical protein [Candidatus Anammoximicrobium sp.]